ncbi:MAG: hypothetical protein HQL15_06415 [Candidatus Omnitrophica bacterium]|nr:hypothetical protein [Candidatus Omnitrophota bacterium]
MGFNDFMNKIRQWDNRSAQFIARHFYILFFEIVLVVIFIATFINSLKIIDVGMDIHKDNILERLLMTQTVNTLLIVILLLFNSFWILYIFNSLTRVRGVLKNIDFNLSNRRNDQRHKDPRP